MSLMHKHQKTKKFKTFINHCYCTIFKILKYDEQKRPFKFQRAMFYKRISQVNNFDIMKRNYLK